jgi:monoamine oxidase
LLAKKLKGRIRLGSPVRSITQDKHGVTVATTKESWRCKFVIVAIPPTLAGQILYNPPMPTVRMQLTQRVPMGTSIKCLAVYPEAFWRTQGNRAWIGLGELPTVSYCADSSPPSGKPGVMVSFIEGTRALATAHLTPAQRKKLVLSDYVGYFGPRMAHPVKYFEQNWPAQPWTAGAACFFTPPGVLSEPFGAAIREPVGRLHWAGTEAATRWMGYVDGAMQAGDRAAKEVRARLWSGAVHRPRSRPPGTNQRGNDDSYSLNGTWPVGLSATASATFAGIGVHRAGIFAARLGFSV